MGFFPSYDFVNAALRPIYRYNTIIFFYGCQRVNRGSTEEHQALTDDAVSDSFIDNEDINDIPF